MPRDPHPYWLAAVHIDQFDPRSDDERLEACYGLTRTCSPVDDPDGPPVSPRTFRSWAYGRDDPQQVWLATDSAREPVGYYMLTLPERENRHIALFEGGPRGRWPLVAVTRRREGVGIALLAHAAEQADRNGRSLLMGGSKSAGPGHAFAEACGARAGFRDVRRILSLDDGLRSKLPGLRAAALPHAARYSLRFWSGPTPDEFISQVCALYDILQDAPHDAAYEPETWDVDRLRAEESQATGLGLRWHRVAAIAEESGDMAALTEVELDPDTPAWGHQGLTAVTRQHRGRRLGMLTKVAMLEWLCAIEPQTQQIFTYNAAQNEHMVAVNEQLGYRASGVFQNWEIDVAAALKLSARV